MSIEYPAWWKGGRWDVERLLRDLFMHQENGAAQGLGGVTVEPWLLALTKREDLLGAGGGILLVHRMGGRVEKRKQQWCDISITQIGAVTESRDQSNLLMSYVTDVLCEFEEGGDVQRAAAHLSGVSTTFMTVPGEVVGPQLIPEQIGDDRLVTSTWEIHADRPRGLPDYREHLGLDW